MPLAERTKAMATEDTEIELSYLFFFLSFSVSSVLSVAKQNGSGSMDIDGKSSLTRWLERLLVAPVLLYRRLRYGYAFRRITFSQPKYAKVDPEDYRRLKKYQWFTVKGTHTFYAARAQKTGTAAHRTIVRMHRQIITPRKGRVIDHVNHDGVDNRAANLREATHAQNMANRKKSRANAASKYKGVGLTKVKCKRKWTAQITVNGKGIHLGSFATEIEAAKAYDQAAKKHHAQFACPNFPNKNPPRTPFHQRLRTYISNLTQRQHEICNL